MSGGNDQMGRATINHRAACSPRRQLPSLWRIVLLAALLASWLPIAKPAQEGLHREEQEAIYLRNFLGFVQWPASAHTGSQSLQLCVEGDVLLAFALSQEFRAVSLADRKVEVRSLGNERELTGCGVLVIGPLEPKRVARILTAAAGTQVMTFGQSDGFLEAGGAVQIIGRQGGFQFAVNLRATNKVRVKLDARLLEMAKRILQDANGAGG